MIHDCFRQKKERKKKSNIFLFNAGSSFILRLKIFDYFCGKIFFNAQREYSPHFYVFVIHQQTNKPNNSIKMQTAKVKKLFICMVNELKEARVICYKNSEQLTHTYIR